MTTPEQRLAEAPESPSLLDEKKYLEERRRQLEASLQGHVAELRTRSVRVGQVALMGGAALVGVWAVVKTVRALRSGKPGKKKARALQAAASGNLRLADEATRPPAEQASGPAFTYADRPEAEMRFQADSVVRPSVLETVLQSDAGKLVVNQLAAVLLVFVTKKLQQVLKLDGSADIGPVKESDLARYRVQVAEPQDAIVVDEFAPDSAAARNFAPNAATRPTNPPV